MGVYQVQTCFQGPTGLPEDRYCNTWHVWIEPGSEPLDWTAGTGVGALGAWIDFYTTVATAALSPQINNPGFTFRVYRLADTIPRSPVYAWTSAGAPIAGGVTGTPLPSECAICLSFEAIVESGTPRARRRGRVYLGPLKTSTIDVIGNMARVDPDVTLDLVTAYQSLRSALLSIAPAVILGIYSPTDGIFLQPATVWVDNDFDTQRRRSPLATARSSVTL